MSNAKAELASPSAGAGVELLSVDLLEEHARRFAALLSIEPRGGGGGGAHLRQVEANMQVLRAVYTALAEEARRESMSPAAEWLLDNFHIVTAAARDVQHDVPSSFFRRLPHIVSDEFAGWPRIHALALELIGSSAGRLDAQRLQRFITAFQSVTPLTMGELWAWPSMLKLALIEHLRAGGDVLAETREHCRAADRLAAAIEMAPQGEHQWPESIHHTFVTRLLQRSRGPGPLASNLHRQLERTLARRSETISSPRASSRAKACTTSLPSWPRSTTPSRRTRCCRTTSSKACTRDGSTAGSPATGRSCRGCFRSSDHGTGSSATPCRRSRGGRSSTTSDAA